MTVRKTRTGCNITYINAHRRFLTTSRYSKWRENEWFFSVHWIHWFMERQWNHLNKASNILLSSIFAPLHLFAYFAIAVVSYSAAYLNLWIKLWSSTRITAVLDIYWTLHANFNNCTKSKNYSSFLLCSFNHFKINIPCKITLQQFINDHQIMTVFYPVTLCHI